MSIVKFIPFSLDDEDNWPQVKMNEWLDVYETDTEVVVKAAVPGIPAEKVNVTFEDGVLRIKAETSDTKEEKEKRKVVYRQQRVSYFDYTTTLPRAVNGDKISAEVNNGVVTIKAPITEAAKPKKIAVQAK